MNVPRLAQSGFVHVLFAFVAMGGWAVFANRMHPMPRPVFAGLVQGALSACITLFLKTTIEYLAACLKGVLALVAPPLAAFALSAGLLTTMHALAGTPEILMTIAVPLTVATIYAAFYNYTLWAREVWNG